MVPSSCSTLTLWLVMFAGHEGAHDFLVGFCLVGLGCSLVHFFGRLRQLFLNLEIPQQGAQRLVGDRDLVQGLALGGDFPMRAY